MLIHTKYLVFVTVFDTLKISLSQERCNSVSFLDDVPQFLTKVTHHGYNEIFNNEYCIGYLDNLQIIVTRDRVSINKGSICKYYLGSNFETLTRVETKKAIEKISDILHLPMDIGIVSRIDIAQNLSMQYKETLYYPYLGDAQYYKRLEQDNGLYYSNSKRLLAFYGKVREQKNKRKIVPNEYQNKNILRYELRFTKRLPSQFNRPEITANLLYDKEFYNELNQRWYSEYASIHKINSNISSMKPASSAKNFVEQFALIGILASGQINVLNKVKEQQEMGLLTKKQAYDIRCKIKQLSKHNTGADNDSLISELDNKIQEAFENNK